MPFLSKTCCAIKSPDPNKTAADRQFVISGRRRRAELAEETFVFSRNAARREGHTCMLGGKLPCVGAHHFPLTRTLWKTRLDSCIAVDPRHRQTPSRAICLRKGLSITHEVRLLPRGAYMRISCILVVIV
jgi:hypothetical protein